MSKFRRREQTRQAKLKTDVNLFTPDASADGYAWTRKGRLPFAHILPEGHERENIGPIWRDDVLHLFAALDIKWHEGSPESPSANLCSSQVCAVNFLAPFVRDRQLALQLVRAIVVAAHANGTELPDPIEVLPFEHDGDPLFVTFEWIGQENYLRERVPKSGRRSRGRHFTSADAAVRFRSSDDRVHSFLIEWKYSEYYSGTSVAISKSGTDRRDIYRHLFVTGCPVSQHDYEGVFFEPVYQLFRQQALALAMEAAREDGTDTVSVIHISPSANTAVHRNTSRPLAFRGGDVFQVWKQVCLVPNRFCAVTTEAVFGPLLSAPLPELIGWSEYLQRRYAPLVGACVKYP